ncbi:hypothetical protein OY671_009505, partial [Metschnikowia pulcherrima]
PTPAPSPPPSAEWSVADAQASLAAIRGIGAEGLFSRDYEPTALAAAIAKGPGPDLNALASRSFVWSAEDSRDGRTPMTARIQWFAVDPDKDVRPPSASSADAVVVMAGGKVSAHVSPTELSAGHPDPAVADSIAAPRKQAQRLAESARG